MSAAHPSPDGVLTALAVDRSSPIPLWFQVAQHFEQSIASGALPQGSLLDNEIVLARRLGISRPTLYGLMQVHGLETDPAKLAEPADAAAGTETAS